MAYYLKNKFILLLTIISILFIFKTTIPVIKYPLFILYPFVFIYIIINNYSKTKQALNTFAFIYKLAIILFSIIIFSLLLSSKLYIDIIKNIFNTLIIFSLYFLYYILIDNKKSFKILLVYFIYLATVFALLTAIYIIFFNPFSPDSLHKIDNNFALIPIFIGIFSTFYFIYKHKNKIVIIGLNILLFIFSLTIILSGSRRGIILFAIILIAVLLSFLLSLINKKNLSAKIIGAKTKYFFITFIILLLITYIFFFQTSIKYKNNIFRVIGIENLLTPKRIIAEKLYRFYMIFDDITFNKFYNILWQNEFDPQDPDSGWGYRRHKTIYPLYGKNIEIVPKKSKGYLMDSTCNANTWKGNAYSYTRYKNDSVQKNDILQASVYCYVSKDFDGEWVKLNSEGATYGNINDFYNLNKKGEWQKLSIKAKCKNGVAPVYLYFAKYGVTDFSTLKGYVIFAYPQYKIIKKDSIQGAIFNPKIPTKVKYQNNLNLLKKQTPKYFYNSMFDFSFNRILEKNLKTNTDTFHKWFSNIFKEDTSYYPYTAEIKIDSISDNFIAPRTIRWQFAWQIFTREYKWCQKLFGGGFDFLSWYGYYFLRDKTKIDWPHNPFLTVLLYSGIFGLLLYLFFLYKVFYYYIKYIKEYYLFFIFFLITFYFSFFSSINPFNPPVTGFFVMMPFLIHAIHQKDKNLNKNNNA